MGEEEDDIRREGRGKEVGGKRGTKVKLRQKRTMTETGNDCNRKGENMLRARKEK